MTARPGQESADLGGLLCAFRCGGASVGLLCLTRGEASPLNSSWCARLEAIRPWEVQLAAAVLGISQVTVAGYPDGGLRGYPEAELAERVGRAIREQRPELLLVIAPEAGDREDAAVALAACAAARRAGVPVLARTVPGGHSGAWVIDLGSGAATARAIQKAAAAAHQSQAQALPELTGRIGRLGGGEPLRWLIPPGERAGDAPPGELAGAAQPAAPGRHHGRGLAAAGWRQDGAWLAGAQGPARPADRRPGGGDPGGTPGASAMSSRDMPRAAQRGTGKWRLPRP